MQILNLPTYDFKLKDQDGVVRIFDEIRKKYLVLTPEEWVRQNFVRFLVKDMNYPASLIAMEIGLKYNQLRKRADILIYDKQGAALLMVECKAPEVKISQDAFDQVARYNMAFKVKYLVVTNGLHHFCCRMNYTDKSYEYLEMIPPFL
jgi:hypothetical protein